MSKKFFLSDFTRKRKKVQGVVRKNKKRVGWKSKDEVGWENSAFKTECSNVISSGGALILSPSFLLPAEDRMRRKREEKRESIIIGGKVISIPCGSGEWRFCPSFPFHLLLLLFAPGGHYCESLLQTPLARIFSSVARLFQTATCLLMEM